MYLYIDNVLDAQSSIFSDRSVNFGKLCIGHAAWSESSGTATGLNGYIKNFKIYKGVAVIPESPTGKIQLDFDNNLNDKYGNSTWMNNSVTFDQVNSVKGYSAYFDNITTDYLETSSESLNFNKGNFKIDFSFKNLNSSGELFSNNISPNSVGSIWYPINPPNSAFGYLDFYGKPSNTTYNDRIIIGNAWYDNSIVKKNNILIEYRNDVVAYIMNGVSDITFNFIGGGMCRIGKPTSTFGPYNGFGGYLDNFKSIKDYQENVIIDKPAVHLLLETNATNIGFTPLTINSVGNPTYTTIDYKKCIKFESGKYLTINSNNIFNLGTNSDFYIEFDFYVLTQDNKYEALIADYNSVWRDSPFILSVLNADPLNNTVYDGHIYFRNAVADINNILITKNSIIRNNWNNLKFYRSNMQIYIVLNDVITESNFNVPIIFNNKFTLGGNGWNENGYLNGYMSNFKMFVGTSEMPETYNDKKILDIDFKPTRKSYLFKDNNNNCVIHPVNITQRDYKNGIYCCKFNGTDQYISLGKNNLFDFGMDDFVLYFKVDISNINSTDDKDDVLIYNNIAWATGSVGISRYVKVNKLTLGLYGTTGFMSDNTFVNGINEIIIVRKGNTLEMTLNNIKTTFNNFNHLVNLNAGGDTIIGKAWHSSINTFFNGYIYSIKVLRNTTDLSLLEDGLDVFNESFKLTNGDETLDQVITNDKKVESHDVRFIKDEESTKLIVDREFVEVPNVENTTDDLILFDNYNGKVSDIKLYDKSFMDEDIFLGNDPIDTEFGEVEYADDEMELFLPEGEFNLIGFIEGYTDRKFSIYNTFYKYELYAGIEDYNITGLDEYSLDDYEINDLVSGEKYKVLTHEMIKGFISGTVNLKNCGVTSNNMEVFCYRSDNYRHIGTYSVDKDGKYVIPNLDVNSRYDIIFRDKTKKIKDQISNYRKPMKY